MGTCTTPDDQITRIEELARKKKVNRLTLNGELPGLALRERWHCVSNDGEGEFGKVREHPHPLSLALLDSSPKRKPA